MPIFQSTSKKTIQLKKNNFKNEKELQNYIEYNLETFFGIRLLATEYTTSKRHGGRIDSLGLDENDIPVIIEYKWGEKDNIINQGLFYLDWLIDHQGDFQLLVNEKLGNNIRVYFGSPRVLLIAKSFNKYDLHAINRVSENIELWSYSRYEQNLFELKLIANSQANNHASSKKKNTKFAYDEYTIEYHLREKSNLIMELFLSLQERIFVMESDQKIEETPRKLYIAYRASRIFMQVWINKSNISINFKMKKEDFSDPRQYLKNVSKGVEQRGVYCECILEQHEDIDIVIKLIEQCYLQFA